MADKNNNDFTVYAYSRGDPTVGISGWNIELKVNSSDNIFEDNMDVFRATFNRFLESWFDDKFICHSNFECPDCFHKNDKDGNCQNRGCVSFQECKVCKTRNDLVYNKEEEDFFCKKCDIIQRL